MKKFIFFNFCLTINFLYPQKLTKVTNVVGYATISGDISPNKAKLLALSDAKVNALKKAGIDENISSYQLLFTSQQKNDFSQFFSSDIQSEIQGNVQEFQIVKDTTILTSSNQTQRELTINAVVVKYETKPDVKFDSHIEGLKAVYNNNAHLVFTVKTTQTCYLTIFNITDVDASVLYPNSYEKQVLLKENILCSFPTNPSIDYTLHTDMKETEVNRLIFVFTKTQIPFIKMDESQVTQNENIFTWIYSIMPDQRKVEYHTLAIQK